jgi:hypothetical protein
MTLFDNSRGPCTIADRLRSYKVDTNQYGELTLMCCTSCGYWDWVWSEQEQKYSSLYRIREEDEALYTRLKAILDEHKLRHL